MTDYKQLCTALADILAQYVSLPDDPEAIALLRRARAALSDPIPEQPMTPTSAGFDGAKGVRIPQPRAGDFRYQLKRGKQFPDDLKNADFLEQLLWLMPDEEDPRLLWCNEDDQWFELEFNPIDKPYK